MITPIPKNLRDWTRKDLIGLILQQAEDIRRLQKEQAALKKPTTTSRNSSQSPSRDWKRNRPVEKRSKPRGAKASHVKAERPLVEQPDTVWTYASCPHMAVQRLQNEHLTAIYGMPA